jgi:hypothetical protein
MRQRCPLALVRLAPSRLLPLSPKSSSPPASLPRTPGLHLEPIGRVARAVGWALPLRHDARRWAAAAPLLARHGGTKPGRRGIAPPIERGRGAGQTMALGRQRLGGGAPGRCDRARGHRPGRARGDAAHRARARAAAAAPMTMAKAAHVHDMAGILTALSALSALVSTAMLVMIPTGGGDER